MCEFSDLDHKNQLASYLVRYISLFVKAKLTLSLNYVNHLKREMCKYFVLGFNCFSKRPSGVDKVFSLHVLATGFEPHPSSTTTVASYLNENFSLE